MTTPSPGIMNHLPRDASFDRRRQDDVERRLREGLAARSAEATSIANGATLLRDPTDATTLVALGTDPDSGEVGVNLHNGGNLNVNDGGNAEVRGGGRLKVLTLDDTGLVVLLGYLALDKPQNGLQLTATAADGTRYIAVDLADYSNDGQQVHQVFSIRDVRGVAVLASDGIGGVGLANPHVGEGAMMNTNITTWPATSSTNWTTVASKYMEIQNPRLTWQIDNYAESSGQLRVLVGGQQAGSVQSVTSSFNTWSTNADLPSGVSVGDVPKIELQARVSGGAGQVYAQTLRLVGQQT